MADKVIYAMYDDDDTLLNGAKHLVKEGVKVSDVYSPFPLHGIDPVIGVEPTRLGIAAFMYGLTGTMLAIIGIRYMMIVDWPMNIGGKPNFSLHENMLSFVPIFFEFEFGAVLGSRSHGPRGPSRGPWVLGSPLVPACILIPTHSHSERGLFPSMVV